MDEANKPAPAYPKPIDWIKLRAYSTFTRPAFNDTPFSLIASILK